MKRFLIHVSTYWCGMDDTFRAVAESEMELWDLAEQLAYDNFQSYSCENDIAEEEGYDPDEMEELSNYFGKEKVALERERKLTRLEERLSKYEQV